MRVSALDRGASESVVQQPLVTCTLPFPCILALFAGELSLFEFPCAQRSVAESVVQECESKGEQDIGDQHHAMMRHQALQDPMDGPGLAGLPAPTVSPLTDLVNREEEPDIPLDDGHLKELSVKVRGGACTADSQALVSRKIVTHALQTVKLCSQESDMLSDTPMCLSRQLGRV